MDGVKREKICLVFEKFRRTYGDGPDMWHRILEKNS